MVSTLSQAKMLSFSAPHSAQHSPFSEPQEATPSVAFSTVPCLCPRGYRKSKFNWYIRTSITATKNITLFSLLSHSLCPILFSLGPFKGIKPKMTVLLKGIQTTFVYIIKFILGEKTLSIKTFRTKFHVQKNWPFQPKSLSPPLPGTGPHRMVAVWVRKVVWLRDRAQALMLSPPLWSSVSSFAQWQDWTQCPPQFLSTLKCHDSLTSVRLYVSSSQSKLRRKII